MRDKIVIPKSACTNLTELSCCNHNYYMLPFGIKIKGNDVILEKYDHYSETYSYVLGRKVGKEIDLSNSFSYASSLCSDVLKNQIILDLSLEKVNSF